VTGGRPVPRVVVPRPSALEVSEIAWLSEGVTRQAALSIPAASTSRDLIVGTAVQLGVYRYRGNERLEPGQLITRPDPSTTWAWTLAATLDDLIFEGRAYWRVLARDSEGYPALARWVPLGDVTPHTNEHGGSYAELLGYRVAGEDGVVPEPDLIRFDSPLPGVLQTGGRTLAAAIELEDAARRLASVELPAGVLKNEGTELNEDEAEAMVARFSQMRREHGVAFVQGVGYSRENLSPADLQLVEARAQAATDVARLFNAPVSMIGASPTGGASALLYSNLSQQLAVMVSTAVAPYLVTVESTLSDRCYPRGTSVAFDVQTFLRSDPQAAADYAIALYAADLVSKDEARSFLGIGAAAAASSPSSLAPGEV